MEVFKTYSKNYPTFHLFKNRVPSFTGLLEFSVSNPIFVILGDSGVVSGGGKKSINGQEKNSKKKSQRGEDFFFLLITFLRLNFFLARLDFSPQPLTAPGSPRMNFCEL